MLRAGYDVQLSAGAITAGGCLGILIPPSVLLIVYGATAGVSVVQLYAGAFFPGLMLAGLYIVYVIVLAKLKPSTGAAAVGRAAHGAAAGAAGNGWPRRLGQRALPALLARAEGPRATTTCRAATLLRQLGIALLPALLFAVLWRCCSSPSRDAAAAADAPPALQQIGASRPAPAEPPGAAACRSRRAGRRLAASRPRVGRAGGAARRGRRAGRAAGRRRRAEPPARVPSPRRAAPAAGAREPPGASAAPARRPTRARDRPLDRLLDRPRRRRCSRWSASTRCSASRGSRSSRCC